jgi:hypothetical protein
MLLLLKYEAVCVNGVNHLVYIPTQVSIRVSDEMLVPEESPNGLYVSAYAAGGGIYTYAAIKDIEGGGIEFGALGRRVYVTFYFAWVDPAKYQ